MVIDSFRENYQPWLPFSISLPPNSGLLLSTVYILASRHHSHQTASIFESLLPKWQSYLLSCFIANPGSLGVDTVQALSILTLWFPFTRNGLSSIATSSPGDPISNPWLAPAQCSLQELAVKVAREAGLDMALVVLKQATTFGIEIEERERQRLLEKARLVNLRVFTQLSRDI